VIINKPSIYLSFKPIFSNLLARTPHWENRLKIQFILLGQLEYNRKMHDKVSVQSRPYPAWKMTVLPDSKWKKIDLTVQGRQNFT